MTQDLKNRIFGTLARGLIKTIAVNQNIQSATASVLADEELDSIERLENYGFTSFPDDNAQGLIAFIGGNREHGVVLSADNPAGKKVLAKGEAAFYTKFGQSIHMKTDGSIEISGKDGKALIKMLASGNINITAEKISVNNATDDLVSLVVDLITAIEQITVNTSIGPQPVVNLASFTALKTKVGAFKE